MGGDISSANERIRIGHTKYHLELLGLFQNKLAQIESKDDKEGKQKKKGGRNRRLKNFAITKESVESISLLGRFGMQPFDDKIAGLKKKIKEDVARRQNHAKALKAAQDAADSAAAGGGDDKATKDEAATTAATKDDEATAVATKDGGATAVATKDDEATATVTKEDEAVAAEPAAAAAMTLMEAYRLKVVGCFSASGSSPKDLELDPTKMTVKLLAAALGERQLSTSGRKAALQARLRRYLADEIQEDDIGESFQAQLKDSVAIVADPETPAATAMDAETTAPVAAVVSGSAVTPEICRLLIRLKKPLVVTPADEKAGTAAAEANLVLVSLKPTFFGNHKNAKPRKKPRRTCDETVQLACGEGGSLNEFMATVDEADKKQFSELLETYLEEKAESTCTVMCDNGCGTLLHKYQVEVHKKYRCKFREATCSLCGEVMPFQDLTSTHPAKCPKAKIVCPSGCGMTMARDEIEEHVASACPKRIVCCPYACHGCKMECKQDVLKDHLNSSVHAHLELVSKALLKLQDAVLQSGIKLIDDNL